MANLPQGEIDYRKMMAEGQAKEQTLRQVEEIIRQKGMKFATQILTLDGFLNYMEGKALTIDDFKPDF